MAAPAASIAAVAASAVAAARAVAGAAAGGSAAFVVAAAAAAPVAASAAGAEVQEALPASEAETVVQTRLVALQAFLHQVSLHREELLALAASRLTACRFALPLALADGLRQPPMPDGVTANLVVAGGRSMEVG